MPEQLGSIAAILGVIVAAVAAFEGIRRAIVMPLVRAVRTIARFLSDFFGEDARPGVDRKPGVMELLHELRSEQAEMKQKLIRVEYHTGNGHEPALRTIVEAQGVEIQKIKAEVTPKTAKPRRAT